MALPSDAAARAHVLELDVTSDASVAAAAAAVRAALGDSNRLDAIVNNAGVGLATLVDAASTAAMLDTNLRGPMRVSSAFLPLLKAAGGRVVNVGSGSGPTYVKALIEGGGQAAAKALMEPADTEAVLAHATAHLGSAASDKAYKGYGLSKACLTAWSQVFAREHPALICVTCSPGFINTKLTAGFGVSAARAPAVLRPSPSALFLTLSSTAFASLSTLPQASKTPEEGTLAIKHCLFTAGPEASGWYIGSDAVRSPLHFMRNPGEPAFDGTQPF